MRMKFSRLPIIFGYTMILILVTAIGYAYYNEEHTLCVMDDKSHFANELHRDINVLNMHLTTLALMGETAVEWTERDREAYRHQRLLIDSILYKFSRSFVSEASNIDSLRTLLADKEDKLCEIAETYRQQKALGEEMANRLPVIARQSAREEPQKTKRNGFLGIFGKKEEPKPTATTAMLYSFNRDLMAQRNAQNRQLKAHADSLSLQNRLFNEKMRSLISQLDGKAQENLIMREQEITETRNESYRDIGVLTCIVLLMLLASYIIIHRDIRRRDCYKQKLEDSIRQNKSLLEMRKKIILTISHDIRGPLTVISGSAELAIDTRDKKKRDGYLNNARFLCRHVVHLLNNLLDVYRLNEAKETPNNLPFRLNILLDRIATGTEQVINDKGLLFIHNFRNVDVTVNGDEDRIEQIADNLLSNAVKFTKSGTVGITAEYSDGKLSMEISDTGMGMTEETVGRIFNPFERADNVDHVEGFGLGLPITKGLVSLLGGTIDVVSNVGKGSMFHVVIPLPEADCSCVPNPPAEKSTGKLRLPSSVLVVDDDPSQCGIVREMLERNSVSCTVSTTVSGVVKAMRERDYDILLTDINMPGTNGFALFELLRKSTIGNSRDIPVIAMTARDDEDNRTLLGHGFSGCIFKPFSMQELLERISIVNVRCKMVADVDLSMLTADVVNKTGILRTLIDTTESDKSALKTAVADNNRKAIGNILHRMYSMWTMLHLETELQALRTAVKDKKTPAENIKALSDRVINVMEMLIENAKEEMEALKYEEQDFDR